MTSKTFLYSLRLTAAVDISAITCYNITISKIRRYAYSTKKKYRDVSNNFSLRRIQFLNGIFMKISGFLRKPAVLEKVGFSSSTLQRYINDPVKAFPPPIRLSSRLSVWVDSEVDAWKLKQIAEVTAK